MNNFTNQVIIDEVKNLISYSISNREIENTKFENLHRSILEKYFGARNIKINYEMQTVDLQLPIANNHYTPISFECLDLNSFLQSCLKSDEQSLDFYQSLLINFDVVTAA